MKYMLLIYADEEAADEAARQSCYEESTVIANQLAAEGKYLGSSPLHPVSTATCVRVRDQRSLITDGPFTETREQLGGYFLVNADNLDDALAIASSLPAATWGTIEVRPVLELQGLPKNSQSEVEIAAAGSTYGGE